MRGRFLAVLAVAAAGMCFPASAAAKYSVSLTRTTGGVANISGENFADVGFGIGYAQAQDGICLLAETFLTVDGERSAFLGPEGVFKNESEGGLRVHEPQLGHLLDLDQAESHGPESAEAPLPAGTLDGRRSKR